MKHNTVYYDIFESKDYYEYHCSHNRHHVESRQALSRRIRKDHPESGKHLMSYLYLTSGPDMVRVMSRNAEVVQ